LAVSVFDADAAALDAEDAVGDVAELENIALEALHGEIFVDGPNDSGLRFEDHLEIGVVGDRPARGDGGEACTAAATKLMVHGVVIDQRAVTPASGGEAFSQHADDFVKFRLFQRAVGICTAKQLEQACLIPLTRGDLGDNLLCQDVQRLLWDAEAVELAPPHRIQQGRAFHKIITREWKESTLGRAAHRVAGTADPLQECRYGAG
jgi:hypothetical protein